MKKPLVTAGQDWSFDLIEEVLDHIERIAKDNYHLNTYRNQIEVVGAEQMLDAYCVAPDHKLLRDDLRWIPAGEVTVGETVLGFDEQGPHRKFKQAKVTRVEQDEQELFEVLLASGNVLKVTNDHLWLIRHKRGKTSRLYWKRTAELRGENDESGYQQSCVPKVIDTWEEDNSRDSGWLAGMYDGEGHLLTSPTNSLGAVGISQRPTLVLEKLKTVLDSFEVAYAVYDKPDSDCKSLHLLGQVRDKLEFLGTHRPDRLIDKVDFNNLGLMKTPQYEKVVSVESIGIQTIVKITTDIGTFVCDGYPMHNCSVGIPVYYSHWSFGEQFVKQLKSYERGRMGLAYEMVLNTNPCIAYLMEENTMMMQTLVMAHASFGHNHFFKNNYIYKQWTDAEGVLEYFMFAKKYVRECEELYGEKEVEAVLDAAHALQNYGVDKYKRPSRLSAEEERKLTKERERAIQEQLNVIWRTVPVTTDKDDKVEDVRFPSEPQENILYFIEKNAPRLETWQREIIRIVRKISQYFYPQGLTKLMNEGCATFFHYKIMHDLHDEGIVDEGAMLEFYTSHSGVVMQPVYNSDYFSGINPYALGFAMYKEIERVATEPTQEDRDWFGRQEWVGSGDWLKTILWAVENFKDESFIQQFLTPNLMREFKMFAFVDDEEDDHYTISGIHNERGYKRIREVLSQQYNHSNWYPEIQVYDVDQWGDRGITLRHTMYNGKSLEPNTALATTEHLAWLWGYDATIESVDLTGEVRSIWEVTENGSSSDIFLDD